MRALELPLAAIQKTLDDDESLAETIQAHLTLLEERRDRTNQQIAVVRQTLHAVQEGQEMSIEEVFAGFDQSQYESEVRERWGDAAWENSAKRRNDMTEEERKADDERSLDVNAALRKAAESGVDPESAEFQAIVGEHHKWVTDHWNGRTPDKNSYTGLSQLYVSDARFAATYGGQANAEIIRNAIQLWAEANLR